MTIEYVSTEKATELVDSGTSLVLGFKAPWCPQCGPQRGVVERVSDNHDSKITFAYIDLEENEDAVEKFGVASLPTILLYKDGTVAERLTGFSSAPKLNNSVESI